MKINITEAKRAFLNSGLIDTNEYHIVKCELKDMLGEPGEFLEWGLYGTVKGITNTIWATGSTFEEALSKFKELSETLVGKSKSGQFIEE